MGVFHTPGARLHTKYAHGGLVFSGSSSLFVCGQHRRLRSSSHLPAPPPHSPSAPAHSVRSLEKMQGDWHGDAFLFLSEGLEVLPGEPLTMVTAFPTV